MKRSERAMQVWQILVGAAHNRQTLTYGQVAEHLEFEGAGVLSQILGCIMGYCDAKNLPPLTCLVVNQTTGLPGAGQQRLQICLLIVKPSTNKIGFLYTLCKLSILSRMPNTSFNADWRDKAAPAG